MRVPTWIIKHKRINIQDKRLHAKEQTGFGVFLKQQNSEISIPWYNNWNRITQLSYLKANLIPLFITFDLSKTKRWILIFEYNHDV